MSISTPLNSFVEKPGHSQFTPLKTIWLGLLCLVAGSIYLYNPAFGKSEHKESSSLSQYWLEDGKHYNLACERGSNFEKVSETELTLKSGSFLIESEGEISLHLPNATIQLDPKAMTLVRITPGSERIYCLLESLDVESTRQRISMNCGEETILLDHTPRHDELNGEFDVGVRLPKVIEINAKSQAATLEFSLLQAIEREPLLNQIAHSAHSHDRFLREKLMKSAAAIQMVTAQHGPYIPASHSP